MLRPTLLAALLLVLPNVATAQNASDPAPAPNEQAVRVKKALDLLGTIAGQMDKLHSMTNRVRGKSAIADLMWSYDEKRARALFQSASQEVTSSIANTDFTDPQAYQDAWANNQLRQEVVNRIAQHDPELALSFLHDSRLPVPSNPQFSWYVVSETNMELQLASLVAARDPARALQLARATLSRGVNYGVVGVLTNLQQRDPKAAQTFYGEVVDKVKTGDLPGDQNLMNATWSLLNSYQPPQANEQTYRDLIATMTAGILAIKPASQQSINLAQNLNYQVTSSMPMIEKYAPGQAAALRQWSQNVESTLDPSVRMYREMNSAKSVDDLLALVPAYPRELQMQIYQNAAWKAFSSGDTNRARQIVEESISDPAQRRQMLDQFEEQLANRTGNEDQITAARRRISKLRAPEQKAQVLIQLASQFTGKDNRQRALDLLNEAKGYLPSPPENSEQMSAQMQLARTYAQIDGEQSFDVMRPLIGRANELIAAAVALDGFENRFLKEGEWITQGGTNLGNLVNSLTDSLSVLAQIDFDRAITLSDQLERPEVRVMAELQIAEATLKSNNGRSLGFVNSRRVMKE